MVHAWGRVGAWDDYNDDYSAELAPLPIYGNVARFGKGSLSAHSVSPSRFFDSTRVSATGNVVSSVRRAEFRNQFVWPAAGKASRQDVRFGGRQS